VRLRVNVVVDMGIELERWVVRNGPSELEMEPLLIATVFSDNLVSQYRRSMLFALLGRDFSTSAGVRLSDRGQCGTDGSRSGYQCYLQLS
jgi:hypothetical protein